METFSWSVLIGGVAFFFLGLKRARKGLEVLAGDRLRAAMGHVAGNRIAALIFGAFVTIVLQSSGATSAMLVSFTETGLLNLFQASAVLLGADIGTTLVVVLLSIKEITDLALLIVALGVAVQAFGRSRKMRDAGAIVLGFGLIFYGMHLMTLAAGPLKGSEAALKVFAYLSAHPLATLIGSSILAGAVHSAGMIGIAIALAFAGTITFEASIPIVLGANVGSCVTAVLASLGGGTAGRRVALAHTLTKIIGVAIVFPFIPHLAALTDRADLFVSGVFPEYAAGIASKIALTHILFNLGVVALFMPLLKPLVKTVETILPMPPPKEEPFGPLYLDKSALQTPAIAFAQAKREIMRLGSIAQQLTADCLRMFSKGEDIREIMERIETEDDKIDLLEKAIRFYLAQVTTEQISEEQSKTQIALISIAAGMEEIGDIISKELASLARKKAQWRRLFSDQGWHDLRSFQTMVMENFNFMMLALAQPHEEIAMKLRRHEEHMNAVEQDLRHAHISRLHKGLKESFDTSSIHMDILTNLRRINSRITRIAELACEGA
ncbi:MAG: Na/Pi cotransporter family protein [bacterium]